MKPIFTNPGLRKEQGLLSLREAAAFLGVSNTSITAYRNAGKLPPPVSANKSGRVALWSLDGMAAFKATMTEGFGLGTLALAKRFHALEPIYRAKNRCGEANPRHLGKVKVDGEWG